MSESRNRGLRPMLTASAAPIEFVGQNRAAAVKPARTSLRPIPAFRSSRHGGDFGGIRSSLRAPLLSLDEGATPRHWTPRNIIVLAWTCGNKARYIHKY